MDWGNAVAGGGIAGLILSITYVGRLALDWAKERKTGSVSEKSASVTDAATANTVILKSLEAVVAENGRMQRKIKHLEDESAEKDFKIKDLESRLAGALSQIKDIADELAQLKTVH